MSLLYCLCLGSRKEGTSTLHGLSIHSATKHALAFTAGRLFAAASVARSLPARTCQTSQVYVAFLASRNPRQPLQFPKASQSAPYWLLSGVPDSWNRLRRRQQPVIDSFVLISDLGREWHCEGERLSDNLH